MCDVAYAAWMGQLEGDARAEVASGLSGRSVADVRQTLEDHLRSEPPRLRLARHELDLRRSLGVA